MAASSRLLAVLVLPLLACGYRSREQVLTAADLAVPERTRLTNYMSAPIRPGSPTEHPPVASITRAALLDEAHIAKTSEGEVCFDIVVRTGTEKDTAISDMRILVDGKAARIGAEEVAVHDHEFSGERDVLVAEHVNRNAFSSLRLTQPVEKVFRVIERRARVCRTMAAPRRGELSLEVILVEDDNRGNWGEKFVWRIE
jgi:hypothetical protein